MLSFPTDTTCIRCTSARKQIAISWSSCANDASILCENFVKFGPVTGTNCRVDRAHLLTLGTTRQKTGVFRGISPDILDRFLQSFHHMNALYVQMIDLYSTYFPICQGTLPCQPNNAVVMKAN